MSTGIRPKIAITGHRPNKLGNDYDLVSPLIRSIELRLQDIINTYNPIWLISGMALGIDTLWARLALKNSVPLACVIPHKGQELIWPKKSQDAYHFILNQSQKIVIVDTNTVFDSELDSPDPYDLFLIASNTPYSTLKMQKRNIWMVDNCDILVAVWDKSSGGTANCVKYAESVGRNIIFIDPNDCI